MTSRVEKYLVFMKGLKLLHSQTAKKFPYQRERSRDVRILAIGQKLKNFFKQDIHILIGIMMG